MFNDAEGEIYRLQDEKECLVAEVERLKARGIEDMQHEIKQMREALGAAEKVVEAARNLALEDAFLGGPPLTPDQAVAFRLKVAPLIAEFDKLKEEK